MSDLHSRIRFHIDICLTLARGATPGPWEYATVRGVTSIGAPGILPSVAQDVAHDIDVHYLLAHAPDDAIRRYSSALRVLERHASIPAAANDPWRMPSCAKCDVWHPCNEIADLAASLGLDTEGSTTDG